MQPENQHPLSFLKFDAMKRLIPFLLLPLFFFSCDEDRISFTEPQPANVEPDAQLRDRFQGRYFCDADSTWLVIKSTTVEERTLPIDVGISDVHVDVKGDNETQVSADFGKDSSVSVRVKIDGDQMADSVNIKGDVTEGIFDMKRGDEARFFRGYYFLNLPQEEGDGYKVRILRKTNEGILLCRIESDSVLKLLEDEEFIEKKNSDDDAHWRLSPSRRELKRLINRGLFSNVRAYRKVE